MSRLVTLMYHAVYADAGDLETIDPEDRPYAVKLSDFVAQLDAIAAAGTVVSSVDAGLAPAGSGNRVSILLTFDDGHGSNYRLVYPELKRRGWGGTFFVTTDFIGVRRGFCNWQQLREMVEGGMTVGSHGKTHRFLDDLDSRELQDELVASRAAIEERTGCRADSISFPGGRHDRNVVKACAAAGFRHVFTSIVGSNEYSVGGLDDGVRRVAIRATTSVAQLSSLLHADGFALRRAARADRIKQAVKSLLGNRWYHFLYRKLAT